MLQFFVFVFFFLFLYGHAIVYLLSEEKICKESLSHNILRTPCVNNKQPPDGLYSTSVSVSRATKSLMKNYGINPFKCGFCNRNSCNNVLIVVANITTTNERKESARKTIQMDGKATHCQCDLVNFDSNSHSDMKSSRLNQSDSIRNRFRK